MDTFSPPPSPSLAPSSSSSSSPTMDSFSYVPIDADSPRIDLILPAFTPPPGKTEGEGEAEQETQVEEVGRVGMQQRLRVMPVAKVQTVLAFYFGTIAAISPSYCAYPVKEQTRIRVIDKVTGEHCSANGHHDTIHHIELAPDASGYMVSCDRSGYLNLWKVSSSSASRSKKQTLSARLLLELRPTAPGLLFRRISFHPVHTDIFVATAHNSQVYIFSIRCLLAEQHSRGISQDSEEDEHVSLLLQDVVYGVLGGTTSPHSSVVVSTSFSLDGKFLSSVDSSGQIVLSSCDFSRLCGTPDVVISNEDLSSCCSIESSLRYPGSQFFSVSFVGNQAIVAGGKENRSLKLFRIDSNFRDESESWNLRFVQSLDLSEEDVKVSSMTNQIASVPGTDLLFLYNLLSKKMHILHLSDHAGFDAIFPFQIDSLLVAVKVMIENRDDEDIVNILAIHLDQVQLWMLNPRQCIPKLRAPMNVEGDIEITTDDASCSLAAPVEAEDEVEADDTTFEDAKSCSSDYADEESSPNPVVLDEDTVSSNIVEETPNRLRNPVLARIRGPPTPPPSPASAEDVCQLVDERGGVLVVSDGLEESSNGSPGSHHSDIPNPPPTEVSLADSSHSMEGNSCPEEQFVSVPLSNLFTSNKSADSLVPSAVENRSPVEYSPEPLSSSIAPPCSFDSVSVSSPQEKVCGSFLDLTRFQDFLNEFSSTTSDFVSSMDQILNEDLPCHLEAVLQESLIPPLREFFDRKLETLFAESDDSVIGKIVSKTATILEKSLSAAVSRVQQTLRDKFTVQNFSSVIENCVNEVFRTVLIDSMLPKFETVSQRMMLQLNEATTSSLNYFMSAGVEEMIRRVQSVYAEREDRLISIINAQNERISGFDRILIQNMELLHTIHQSCNLHASSMLGIQEISKSVSHRLSEVEESIHSIDDRLRRAPSISTSYHSNVNQVVQEVIDLVSERRVSDALERMLSEQDASVRGRVMTQFCLQVSPSSVFQKKVKVAQDSLIRTMQEWILILQTDDDERTLHSVLLWMQKGIGALNSDDESPVIEQLIGDVRDLLDRLRGTLESSGGEVVDDIRNTELILNARFSFDN